MQKITSFVDLQDCQQFYNRHTVTHEFLPFSNWNKNHTSEVKWAPPPSTINSHRAEGPCFEWEDVSNKVAIPTLITKKYWCGNTHNSGTHQMSASSLVLFYHLLNCLFQNANYLLPFLSHFTARLAAFPFPHILPTVFSICLREQHN